jgi:sugar lactone lactonase YvrE
LTMARKYVVPVVVATILGAITLEGCGSPPGPTGPTPGPAPGPAPTPAPTPIVEIFSSEGADLLDEGAKLTMVGREDQFTFTEGPMWLPDQKMWIFSDIRTNISHVWFPSNNTIEDFRNPSFMSNGHFLDKNGLLWTAEQGVTHGISSTDLSTGVRTFRVGMYNNAAMNAPNDIVVSKKLQVYFTDPNYRSDTQPKQNVFKYDPATDEVVSVEDSHEKPNGLVFSPDESKMYVTAADPKHIKVYDVAAYGLLNNGAVFVNLPEGHGSADGMKCDLAGNLWAACPKGVLIYTPAGKLIARINVPGYGATNLAFGGESGMELLITARDAVYTIPTKTKSGIEGVAMSEFVF